MVDKETINDVAILMYKNYTQMAISIELGVTLEVVREVQTKLSTGEQNIYGYYHSSTTVDRIRKMERKLFRLLDEWEEEGKQNHNLELLGQINSLSLEYSHVHI